MLMSFVYHRFHADRELSLLAGHAHPVGIDTANFTPLAMRVSRRECLLVRRRVDGVKRPAMRRKHVGEGFGEVRQ